MSSQVSSTGIPNNRYDYMAGAKAIYEEIIKRQRLVGAMPWDKLTAAQCHSWEMILKTGITAARNARQAKEGAQAAKRI